MKVKADRDESSPYAAMLAAQDVAVRCKELGINALRKSIQRSSDHIPPFLLSSTILSIHDNANYMALKTLRFEQLARLGPLFLQNIANYSQEETVPRHQAQELNPPSALSLVPV